MNRTTARAAAAAALAALTFGPVATALPATAAPVSTVVHAKPGASYYIDAWTKTDTAVAGETVVTVRGRVWRRAAGERVVLQQRVGAKKKWVATGKAKIKRNGTYKVTDKPTTPGAREYRVVKPRSKGSPRGISQRMPVQVYRWESLVFRVSGPRENLDATAVHIGAEHYSRSLASRTAGAPASVEYTLGRTCTTMRSTYALTDASATGSSGAVTVSADGKVLASHSLAIGTIVADEELDLTGVYRIKLVLDTSAEPVAQAALATPEVLCTR